MTILTRFGLVTTVLAVFCAGVTNASAATPAPGIERFYIGTYNSNTNRGIYEATLDPATGTFGPVNLVGAAIDPSFIALTPDDRFLYAVNEGPGTVSAFSVDPVTHHLTFLNKQSSQGAAPCHLAVDRTGRNVIVANYTGGSITMFPIETNGMLGAANAHFQDPGKKPHAHCVTIDQNNHFVFICDLGLDQVRCYVLDAQAGTLITNTAFTITLPAGSGPRHMTFDPQYKRAYVICEISSRVFGFNYDATTGVLTPFQSVSTLPTGFTNKNTCAEIAVHPSGKFLYGSNRGHNSIAVFKINQGNWPLTDVIQEQPVGIMPRNFAIDSTGKWCIVANQGSNSILLYSIDPQTGLLTPTGQSLAISKPVCILPFVPPSP